jgi:DNA mismatch endonuclease (patch repair protein)
LNGKGLPGRPDLVFKGLRRVIFVHGCFWHRHNQCALARLPKSRHDFWIPKLESNRTRDLKNLQKLKEEGWDVLVVWECQLRDLDGVTARVDGFLKKGLG